MRSSTLLGWLLVGSVLAGVLGMLLWQLTHIVLFAVMARLGLGIALGTMVLAFIANYRDASRRERARQQQSGQDDPTAKP